MKRIKQTKRIGSIFLALCMVLTMLPVAVFAETGAVSTLGSGVDITNKFTDANFLAAVRDKIGKGKTDEIYDTDVALVGYLNVSEKNIASLAGIEYFTALTDLNCSRNQLTELDVGNNTALTNLDCSRNQLTELDVSSNTALTELNCYNNRLKTLDVSNNIVLKELNCSFNEMETLNVSGNKALTKLYCYMNQLETLNVSNNTALTVLDCSYNQLTTLNVSNTVLSDLNCYNNQLTELDVSSNTALTDLDCSLNQLTTLIVNSNTTLTSLNCYNNQLAKLDMSSNTALTYLDCSYNQLTSLNVSSNTALTKLYCFSNQLTTLDVSSNTALTSLDCYSNLLTTLDLSGSKALTSLGCFDNHLTELDVSSNTALTSLNCYNNYMSDESAIKGLNESLTTNFTFQPQNSGTPPTNTYTATINIYRNDAAFSDDTEYILKCSGSETTTITMTGKGTSTRTASVPNGTWKVYDSSVYTGVDIVISGAASSARLDMYTISYSADTQGTATDGSLGVVVIDADGNDYSFSPPELLPDFFYKDSAVTINASAKSAKSFTCEWSGTHNGTPINGTSNTYKIDSVKGEVDITCTITGIGANSIVTDKFTDAKFLAAVRDEIGKGKTDEIYDTDVASIEILDVSSKNIESLAGIEYFTALTDLNCSSNKLETLDVSNNTALKELYCYMNQLETLDVISNTALTDLDCSNNQLKTLDVSSNTALTDLDCSNNQLTTLNVSNTALTSLKCSNNQLTELDVSNNTALTDLDCSSNQLKELEVSKNTALTNLNCSGNQLTELIVSENTALTDLDCSSNKLETLDVSNNTALKELYCSSNALTTLNVSSNTALKELYCSSNALTTLVVSSNKSSNTALTYLDCYFNQLKELDVSSNTALTSLDCSSNKLKELDVSSNTALAYLICSSNLLTTLDVSSNTALTSLICSYNYMPDETAIEGLNESLTTNFTFQPQNESLIVITGFKSIPDMNVGKAGRANYTSVDELLNSLNTSYGFVQAIHSGTETCDWPITGWEDTDGYNPAVAGSYTFTATLGTAPTGYTNNGGHTVTMEVVVDAAGSKITEKFTDDNFLAAVRKKVGWSVIYDTDVASIEILDVSSKNIESLAGIEYFTALTDLDCSSNQLTTLNESGNTALTKLNCSSNQLTTLNVSSNTALTDLDCSSNQLTTLNVSNALTELNCSINQLPALNVSSNTALTYLNCSSNQLKELEVSKNTALTELNCYSNALTALNVSKNTALTELDCYSNALTALNVSSNTELTSLDCSSNQLKELEVSKNTALTELYCSSNALTALNVSSNTELTNLDCSRNQLKELNVSSNTALTELYCSRNQLKELEVSKNTALTELYCYSNALTALNVSSNTALTYLDCSRNQLKALNVSSNTALTYLDCSSNYLTELEVSSNAALTELDCSGNHLTELDVRSNAALTELDCSSNLLTELDVRSNASLFTLDCSKNYISDVDAIIGLNESLTTSFTFEQQNSGTPPTPVCGISLDTGNYTFPTASLNYNAQAAKTVTIRNTGNQPTGSLTVSMSGTNSTAFEISTASVRSIAKDGKDSFAIVPKTGLAAGIYTATVNVAGGHNIAALANVSFTVNETAQTYTITVNNGSANPTTASANTTVTITANEAPNGQRFKSWKVNSGNVTLANADAASTTFTMPAGAVDLTATYEALPVNTYSITVRSDGNGMANANVTSAVQGIEITLTAVPNSGYRFKEWQVNSSVTISNNKFTMPAENVTAKAIFEVISAPTFTVTVNGSYAGTTGAGSYTEGAAVTIAAGSRSNYRFTGWSAIDITLANPGSASTTFTMPANNVTVTANWSYIGSSDVPGSGSDTIVQPTAPAANGSIQVNYTTSGGTASLVLPDAKVDEIINNSKDDEAVIDLSKVSGITAAELSKTAVTAMSEAGLDITVKLPVGNITINEDAAASVVKQAEGGNLKLEIKQVAPASLTNEQKQAVKSGDLVLDINILSGTKKISSFSGTLTVTVPYSGPQPVAVWYLNDKGELEKLSCTFKDGEVSFDLNHLSLYVVGQDTVEPVEPAWVNPFNDVKETDWFYKNVEYVYENGLMAGTSTEPMKFSPHDATNRAMLVTILYRLEGSPEVTAANVFSDVNDDTYYAKAVMWAFENKIVSGYSNSRFGPMDSLAREQIASIMYRYARYKGYNVTGGADLSAFEDADAISYWAKEAMSWASGKGLILGDGNKLAPDANTERCQTAAILQRFIETNTK